MDGTCFYRLGIFQKQQADAAARVEWCSCDFRYLRMLCNMLTIPTLTNAVFNDFLIVLRIQPRHIPTVSPTPTSPAPASAESLTPSE
jgi:hypothetical protein